MDKCQKCGGEIGNNVFTVCDDCWDDESEPTEVERLKARIKKLTSQLLSEQILRKKDGYHQINQEVEMNALKKRIKGLEEHCETMMERDEVDSIIEHRDRIFAEKDATIKELQEEI